LAIFGGVSCPGPETNGDVEWPGNTICQGCLIPDANTFRSLPIGLRERMSYRYGDVLARPWSLPFTIPTSTAA